MILFAACATTEPTPPPDTSVDRISPASDGTRHADAVGPETTDDRGASVAAGCPRYGEYIVTATLDTGELPEASGLAMSGHRPDVLWAHNDSGDGPTLYAISTSGALLARLHLEGVVANDFEDLARAACPDGSGSCLWVADIGNNNTPRTTFAIHVIPEPIIDETTDAIEDKVVAPIATYTFSYPEEAVDSEALLVASDGSSFWLIEKVDGPSARIFAGTVADARAGPFTLALAGLLRSPAIDIPMGRMVTGADLNTTGMAVALRTYIGVFVYRLQEAFAMHTLDRLEPLLVANGPLEEPQGESVTFGVDGELWTLSEDPQGQGFQPLIRYPCLP